MVQFFFDTEENILGKVENAGYQQYVFFTQCHMAYFPQLLKTWDYLIKS